MRHPWQLKLVVGRAVREVPPPVTLGPSRYDVLLGGALCLATVAVLGGALAAAEFGAPAWALVLLLAWLLTLGLPSTAVVLLLARFWQGPSFPVFLLSAFLCAWLFQVSAVWGIRRIATGRRRAA